MASGVARSISSEIEMNSDQTEVPVQIPTTAWHEDTVAATDCCPRHDGRVCIDSREDAGRFGGTFCVSGSESDAPRKSVMVRGLTTEGGML